MVVAGCRLADAWFSGSIAVRPFDKGGFDLRFPVIVKPSHEGSSIGMRKVDDLNSLEDAIAFAQDYDTEILIEQWVTGREYTCAVLGDSALPMIHLKTDHDFTI